MRRAHQRLLGNVIRTCGVCTTLAALGTAWLWTRCPDQVASLEHWLLEFHTAPLRERWRVAQADPDPTRQAQRLDALLGELETVRRQDRLAVVVRDCHRRLADLAKQRGDLASAAAWLREGVAFDDHDLDLQIELGDLLCRRAETRREGLDLLARLLERPHDSTALTHPTFLHHPPLVAMLAAHLTENGRAREALLLLDRAAAMPASNLWTIESSPAAIDAAAAATELVATVDADALHLHCLLEGTCRRLCFHLPPFASLRLRNPRLELRTAAATRTLDVLPTIAGSEAILRTADALEATGAASASFVIDFGEPIAGPVDILFSAAFELRRSALLAAAATAPTMADLAAELAAAGETKLANSLHEWRVAAVQTPVQLAPAVAVTFAPAAADVDFDATFAVHEVLDEIVISLPNLIGYGFRFARAEAAGAGAIADLLPVLDASGQLHDVVRRDGWFSIVGEHPSIRVPRADATALDTVRIVGSVR